MKQCQLEKLKKVISWVVVSSDDDKVGDDDKLRCGMNLRVKYRTLGRRLVLIVVAAVCTLVIVDHGFSLQVIRIRKPLDPAPPVTQTLQPEYQVFDPSKIKTVYRIVGRRYGRTNNILISILHAIDKGLDEHNDTVGEFVVSLSDWSAQLVEDFFFHPKAPRSWGRKLERLNPVVMVHESRLKALNLTQDNENVAFQEIKAKEIYWYGANHWKRHTAKQQEKRRRMIYDVFFRQIGVAEHNFEGFNALIQYFGEKLGVDDSSTQLPKYVAIHSRWLEGKCEEWVGEKLPHDECWMTPKYIKQILGTRIAMPIVLVGDGQNEQVPKKLREDSEIGPRLIVAADLPTIEDNNIGPLNDMVLAMNSEIFIGTRVSSMSLIIAQVRVFLGADPQSNFVYTWRKNSTERGTEASIEVCGDCIWLCNVTQSDVCGGGMPLFA